MNRTTCSHLIVNELLEHVNLIICYLFGFWRLKKQQHLFTSLTDIYDIASLRMNGFGQQNCQEVRVNLPKKAINNDSISDYSSCRTMGDQ